MFDIKESYERLLKSKEFLNKGIFCSAFIICEPKDLENCDLQLDFYDKKDDKVTSYIVSEKIRVLEENSDMLKKNNNIKEININNLKINFKKVIKTVKEKIKSRKEIVTKLVIILQEDKTTLWNISSFTNNFNLLNLRINSKTGRIIEEKVVPLLSWDTGQKV